MKFHWLFFFPLLPQTIVAIDGRFDNRLTELDVLQQLIENPNLLPPKSSVANFPLLIYCIAYRSHSPADA
jgi:hypothetical protein